MTRRGPRPAALVRQYDVQDYGTSVVEYKGRFELVRGSSEQEFTNAVMRLREGRTRKIYFTTGHAERDIDSTERVGYSEIIAALRRDNFAVRSQILRASSMLRKSPRRRSNSVRYQ